MRQFVKFLIEIMILKASCQIFAEEVPKCYQDRKTFCWKMTMAWFKKISHDCVPCVCFRFDTIVMVIAFLVAIGFLMGVMIISFALSIDLHKSL